MAKSNKPPGKKSALAKPDEKSGARKSRVLQSEVPRFAIQEAAQIAEAVAEHYASAPTKSLHLAGALNLTITSSQFRGLLGASAAYGLTTGAYDSEQISLTPLGKKVVDADMDTEKRKILKEGFLRPRVVGAFLREYDNARFPKDQVAAQVLEDLGVPDDSRKSATKLIFDGAKALGLLKTIKDNHYVDLDGVPSATPALEDPEDESDSEEEASGEELKPKAAPEQKIPKPAGVVPSNDRVFITHGKNLEIVTQLKDPLSYGKFLPVVAAEHETVSKPVPDKVMDDMRSCSAAIIHVGKELRLLDETGKEHTFINQNVLIEIGAAMALYRGRFILLVERGATLPSNLQGLYEVRYEGDKLDYEATMKLLKALNEFRQ